MGCIRLVHEGTWGTAAVPQFTRQRYLKKGKKGCGSDAAYGDKNRTVVEEIAHGQGKLTNLQIQAQNKQTTTYNYTINGYGPIVPGTGTKTVAKTSGDTK